MESKTAISFEVFHRGIYNDTGVTSSGGQLFHGVMTHMRTKFQV